MNEELNNILKQAYQDMDAKGIPEGQRKALIEKLANDYNASQKTEQKPGFVQGLAQDVARPFLSIPSTVIGAGKAALTRVGGGSKEDAARALAEGTDFGYFGNVKPLNAPMAEEVLKGNSANQGILRTGLNTAGTTAEIASYFMAPLKVGAGFWNTIKAAVPMAATFGAGKGLQAAGEGKGALESTAIGAGNAIGAAAGYGLFKGGAQLFSNWGARALQNEAVAAAGSRMKDLAEQTWQSLPEAFKGQVTSLADFTNATTRRTVAALRSEFDKNYNTAKDAVIDSLLPEVNTPDLTLGKYQRSLSETMGNMFRESNTLYDNVKADTTKIDSFTLAGQALSKAPRVPVAGEKLSAEEIKSFMEASGKMSEPFFAFLNTMSLSTRQPLTMKQVMGLWQDSMGYLTGATNEERAIIRDFASGLYADARSVLEKKNPELLDQWDGAYQAWKKAVDVYESGPLNALKSVGDVDTFVDTMLTKPMSRPEQEAFVQSLGANKPAVQDLFINSILRKAKQLKPNDGAEFIRGFLDNYDQTLLDPAQAKMLDDVAAFMDGSFDEFVLGMRQAQGLTDEAAGDLLQGQTYDDLLKTVNDGRLDQISERFIKMVDSPELEKTLAAFTPEEKNVIGLSIARGIFDEKLPVAAQNLDGTYKVSPEFASTLIEIGTKIKENKALVKVMSPEQLSALEDAVKFAQKTEDLSDVPAAGFQRLLNGTIAMFYFARGWVPGAIRNAIDAASASGENTYLYYSAVEDLLSQGVLKKNKRIMIGDLMKVVLPGAGQVSTEAVNGNGQ